MQFINNGNLSNPERFPFLRDVIHLIGITMIFMIFGKHYRQLKCNVLKYETQHNEQLQFIQNGSLSNPERFPFLRDLNHCIGITMIFMIFGKCHRQLKQNVLNYETQHIERLQFIHNGNLSNPERFPFLRDLIHYIGIVEHMVIPMMFIAFCAQGKRNKEFKNAHY